MCYSKGYKYRDGDTQMFSTGLSIQLAACETRYSMKGGKRKKVKSKSKKVRGKSKRGKSKRGKSKRNLNR